MKTALLLTLILITGSTMAQSSPVDSRLDQCLNGASTTAAMSACYNEASQAWDSEMNHQYGKLMGKLTGEPKNKLRMAQRAWLAYRDSWLEASQSRYRDQGTLRALSLSAQAVSLVRNQARMLQSLNDGSCANPDDC